MAPYGPLASWGRRQNGRALQWEGVVSDIAMDRSYCAETLRAAAANLFFDCGDLKDSASVLIVHEPPGLGYYDDALAGRLVSVAREMGLRAELAEVAFDREAEALPKAVIDAMREADLSVFFARIGDQLRFQAFPEGTRAVVSYALDTASFASRFGTASYSGFVALKDAVEEALKAADEIVIRCGAGTEIRGSGRSCADETTDVTIMRFPMLMPCPILANGFSGRVALSGFLAGTGSRYYDPFAVEFAGPIAALFEHGRLTGFDGAPGDVALANNHYDIVASRFGIDRNFVHSWHAGIHPACAFLGLASDCYMRWSGSAFGNPRLLHVHTCGAYAPGEICWNVVDPTIIADGVAIWEDGRLFPDRVPGGEPVLKDHPEIAALFRNPSRQIGI